MEVEDDGAGIDVLKVRIMAERRGIAAPDALAAMSEEEITALIFAPGLSTATSVSESVGPGRRDGCRAIGNRTRGRSGRSREPPR